MPKDVDYAFTGLYITFLKTLIEFFKFFLQLSFYFDVLVVKFPV